MTANATSDAGCIGLEAVEAAVRGMAGAARLATLNLITVVTSDQEAQEVARQLAPVLRYYPARVLLPMLPPASHSSARAAVERIWKARVLAPETAPAEDSRAGGEFIQLRGGDSAGMVPALLELLHGDLPTFLWWRRAPAGIECVRTLGPHCQRVIYDSLEASPEAGQWQKLRSQLLPLSTGRSDLAWTRLTRWRRLLAQAAGTPAGRRLWQNLDQVNFMACADQPALNSPALLLSGWLAERLGWSIAGRAGAEELAMKDASGRGFRLAFTHAACSDSHHIQHSIQFQSREARLEIARSGTLIQAELSDRTGPAGRQAGAYPRTDPMAALGQELRILGQDVMFEAAQNQAGELLAALLKP